MPKKDWVPGQGWVERDSSKNAPKKVDDPDVMTQEEVEAEGGLASLIRKRKKPRPTPTTEDQGKALKATPTPSPTTTPKPNRSY